MSGTQESTESYLHLLSPHLVQPHRSLKPPNKGTLLSFLDALAGICVSQPEGQQSREAYAASVAKDAAGCTIFIAGEEENVPLTTQHYLGSVCQQLTGIANLVERADKLTIRRSVMEVSKTILNFTFPRLLAHVTNTPGDEDYIALIRSQLGCTERFDNLLEHLDSLYQLTADVQDAINRKDVEAQDVGLVSIIEELKHMSVTWDLSEPWTFIYLEYFDSMADDSERAC